jgi:Cd2+/Zn2+-exporting ATPase
VTSVIATAENDDNALLALAAAVEQGSSHPLAQAIVREAAAPAEHSAGQRPAALAGSIEAEVNGSRITICAPAKPPRQSMRRRSSSWRAPGKR